MAVTIPVNRKELGDSAIDFLPAPGTASNLIDDEVVKINQRAGGESRIQA